MLKNQIFSLNKNNLKLHNHIKCNLLSNQRYVIKTYGISSFKESKLISKSIKKLKFPVTSQLNLNTQFVCVRRNNNNFFKAGDCLKATALLSFKAAAAYAKNSKQSLSLKGDECFWNQTFDKGRLKNFVLWFLKNHGEHKTVLLVEELKNIGFQYATKAGISLGIEDLKIPPKKYSLIMEAEQLSLATIKQYKRGEITGVERFQRLIDTWHRTSERLKQEVIDNFEATDILNPVYMMAFSGARGNISQVRQLVGMRGLMSNPQGQIIDFPIRSNFREGLTLTEYIISSYGARKGIVDTALRTANAGYLTRRLVDVAQHVIISNFDCGTKRGIFLTDMKEGNKTIYSLQNRLVGRVLARDIYNKQQNKVASRNVEISIDLANSIALISKKVFVRSALTCQTKKLVCQLCYGWSLAQGNLVSIGEAVGVVAAQSIGEPGTQLTMRTFHTGGVFSGDVSDQIRAPFNGIVQYNNPIAGTLIRTPEGKIAFFTKNEGSFTVHTGFNQEQKERTTPDRDCLGQGSCLTAGAVTPSNSTKKFKIPFYTLLFLRNGEKVLEKEVIAQISSINRQKNTTDHAELTIKSDFSGQFYSKFLDLKENKVGPKLKYTDQLLENAVDTIFEAWGWGYAWVLAGKIYQLALPSSFFPIFGDYVNQKSYMNQINWNIASSFGTSFKLNIPASNKKLLNKMVIKQMRKPDDLNFSSHLKGAPLAEDQGSCFDCLPAEVGAASAPKGQTINLSLNKSNLLNKKELTLLKTELVSFQLSKIMYKKIGYFLKLTEPSSSFCFNTHNFTNYFKFSFQEQSSILSTNDTLFLFSSIFSTNNHNLPFIPRGKKEVYPGNILKNKNNSINSVYPAMWRPSFDIFLNWFPKRLTTKSGGLIFMEPIFFGQQNKSQNKSLGFMAKPSTWPRQFLGGAINKKKLKTNMSQKENNLKNFIYGGTALAKELPWPSRLKTKLRTIISVKENKYKANYFDIATNIEKTKLKIKNFTSSLDKQNYNYSFEKQGVVPITSRVLTEINLKNIKLDAGSAAKQSAQVIKSSYRLERQQGSCLEKSQVLSNFSNKFSIKSTLFFPTFVRRNRITSLFEKENYRNSVEIDLTSMNNKLIINNNANLNLIEGELINSNSKLSNFFISDSANKLPWPNALKKFLNKNTADLAKSLILEQYQPKQFGTVIKTGLSGNKNKTKSEILTIGLNWKNAFKLNNDAALAGDYLPAGTSTASVRQSLNDFSYKSTINNKLKNPVYTSYKDKDISVNRHVIQDRTIIEKKNNFMAKPNTLKFLNLQRIFWISQPFYNISLKKNKIFPCISKNILNGSEPILLQLNRQGKIKPFYTEESSIQTNLQSSFKATALLSFKAAIVRQSSPAKVSAFYVQTASAKKNKSILDRNTENLLNLTNLRLDSYSNFKSEKKESTKVFKKDGLYYFTTFDKNLLLTLLKRKKLMDSFFLWRNCLGQVLGRGIKTSCEGSFLSLKIFSKMASFPYFLNKKSLICLKNSFSISKRQKVNIKNKKIKKVNKTGLFNYYFYSLFNKKNQRKGIVPSFAKQGAKAVATTKNINDSSNLNSRDLFSLNKSMKNETIGISSFSWLQHLNRLLKNKYLKIVYFKNKPGRCLPKAKAEAVLQTGQSLLKLKNNNLQGSHLSDYKIAKLLVAIKGSAPCQGQGQGQGSNCKTVLGFAKKNISKKALSKLSNVDNINKDIKLSTKIVYNLMKQQKFKEICSPYLKDQLSYKPIQLENTLEAKLKDKNSFLSYGPEVKSLSVNELFSSKAQAAAAVRQSLVRKEIKNKINNYTTLGEQKKLNSKNLRKSFSFERKRQLNNWFKKSKFYKKIYLKNILKINKKLYSLLFKKNLINKDNFFKAAAYAEFLKQKRQIVELLKKRNQLKKLPLAGSLNQGSNCKTVPLLRIRKETKLGIQKKLNSNGDCLITTTLKSLFHTKNSQNYLSISSEYKNNQKYNKGSLKEKQGYAPAVGQSLAKAVSTLKNIEVITKKLREQNQILNIMLKPGWLYYSTDLSNLLLYNKKLIHPGKSIGNNLVFDRHSVFIEIIPFDIISLAKSINHNFAYDQKNVNTINKFKTIKNDKCRFKPITIESKLFPEKQFFVLIRKASEYKLYNDIEYKKEIYKLANQKNNGPALYNLNSATFKAPALAKSGSPCNIIFKHKNIWPSYSAVKNNIKNLSLLKLINKSYNSINLYSQYKTGFLNKQKITSQTISKYPSSDLKIFSNISFYSSLFKLKQICKFTSKADAALALAGDSHTAVRQFPFELNPNLKINKGSSWGLCSLPIKSTKAINLSPLIISYKSTYNLEFPFKKPIRLFSEQLQNNNKLFLWGSQVLGGARKKGAVSLLQHDLKKVLYSYLSKIDLAYANQIKKTRASALAPDGELSCQGSSKRNYKTLDFYSKENDSLEVAKTISSLSSIFSSPIVEYSLGQNFEKSISYPNNLLGMKNKVNGFILNRNTVDNKSDLFKANMPILGSLNKTFEYNNKNSINKEISLYKTEFVSFRNNGVSTQLPFIKTYTYSSFEGELIYRHSNILNPIESIKYKTKGFAYADKAVSGFINENINSQSKSDIFIYGQGVSDKKLPVPSMHKNKKKGLRSELSKVKQQNLDNQLKLFKSKAVAADAKKEITENKLTNDLFANKNQNNSCMILTKEDQVAFYLPVMQSMKDIYFSLENLKKKNQYVINDVVINYLNILEKNNMGSCLPKAKAETALHNLPEDTNIAYDNEISIKINKLPAGKAQQTSKLSIGEFIVYGDQISPTVAIPKSGQIIHINNKKITIRQGQPIFVSPKAILHKYDGDFIDAQSSVITLAYQQLKTGDIIQGIPKVEQFFEARTTKRGRLFRDSLSNLLKGLFKRYRSKLPLDQAVRQSFYKIQQIIVDGVQRVYRSQGVTIADKHLEVIVKQMTSKVRIIEGGLTGFFPGEIVSLDFIERINSFLTKKIIHEPLVLGITKASLEVDSFLSAASFQQTTRVLSKSAISRKKDFLKGLKENVILGNLIPAGTGYLVYLDKD
jgi:hypothetical protein